MLNDNGKAATALIAPESVAEAFLALLRSRGIANFYINAGTDFAPLVEAYARLHNIAPDVLPRPVVAGHENVSMGMAHGAYLMSGKPQAVMFHVNVGTANALCGAMNAACENVPLMICAGRTPLYENGTLGARNTRVAWAQEMFDQASVIRETVKWEYELRGGLHVEGVVDRALTIAMSEPRGPVYLTLPREVLAERPDVTFSPEPRVAVPAPTRPDAQAVATLADRLAAAEFPVISAIASGADPASVALLAELCDRFAIGYVEEQGRYLNLPTTHPLHLGFSFGPVFPHADVMLFVESDSPWIEAFSAPRAETFIAQAGVDPNFGTYPMRTHRSDLAIQCGPSALFAALAEALEARRDRIAPDRRARLAAHAAANRAAADAATAAELAADGPISMAFLSATLGRVLHEDCVLFNEYSMGLQHFTMTRPQSHFYLPAVGGLGWGLPAALGAKIEAPERTMVVACGDGTYMFANPVAAHHAGRKHGLPVLTVIGNNARWNAVDWTARLVYPEGAMTRQDWHSVSDLRPAPDYEKLVEASGGYGVVVSERAELEAVLRKALAVVEQDRRQAVVNVICA